MSVETTERDAARRLRRSFCKTVPLKGTHYDTTMMHDEQTTRCVAPAQTQQPQDQMVEQNDSTTAEVPQRPAGEQPREHEQSSDAAKGAPRPTLLRLGRLSSTKSASINC